MNRRAVAALIEAYVREDRRKDRRLMIAVRVGVNGSPEEARDFCADYGGGRRVTEAEILADAERAELEGEGDSGDRTGDPPSG